MCVYPVYLLRRTVLARQIDRPVIKYLHVVMLVFALVVDIGVFVSLVSGFFSHRG